MVITNVINYRFNLPGASLQGDNDTMVVGQWDDYGITRYASYVIQYVRLIIVIVNNVARKFHKKLALKLVERNIEGCGMLK